jgi:2-keto-4-pentenoate hydratase
MGEVVGYKVAFTGKATQKQLGITTPAFGVLFSEMFLPDGARISSDYGLRPFIEPDLMVVVKDEGLMDATTEIEVAAHLSSVHALMELTSLPFPVEEAVNGSALVALNLMATYMVMGPGVAVEATPEFVAALAAMETEFTDESGRVIQRSGVSSLMGNPLRVVLWLVAECHRQGRTLRGGDRLSLGAVGRMFPLERGGKTFTYTLNGLPAGALTTSIRVESL